MSKPRLLATMSGLLLWTVSAFADDRPQAQTRADSIHGSNIQGAAAP